MKIGVNENVNLSKVELNDKGTLEVTFATVLEGEESIEDLINEGDDTVDVSEDTFKVLFFAPTVTQLGGEKKGEPEAPERILKSITDLAGRLKHILKMYTDIKSVPFNAFRGTGIDATSKKDIHAGIVQADITEKIYNNIVEDFVEHINRVVDFGDPVNLRLFLIRRSEAVHFGTLRKGKTLDKYPFLELSSVPITKSKMYTIESGKTTKFHEPVLIDGVNYVPLFDDWEIGKKLDDTKVITPESKAKAGEEEENVGKLFNAGAEEGGSVGFAIIEE